MLSFLFRINASFRGYPSHPITIPKSRVDYGEVDRLAKGATAVDIVFPNNERVPARVSRSVAGFGAYRQICTRGWAKWPESTAKQGEFVDVSMARSDGRLEIVVSAR